jgi:BMFP domain-containing protein YqiC
MKRLGTAAMINLTSIEDLARRLSDLVPPGLSEARDDLEKNFRAALQSSLSKLDLVTREEFDVQRAVLLRTREKLDLLERLLVEMEARLDAAAPSARN